MHKPSFAFASLLTIIAFVLSVAPAFAVSLPGGNAIFETSLQSRITASDTSMTLVSNSSGGETISGYQCFTLDEGRSDAEFVCGTVSGTSVTGLERGISYTTGTTSITARKFPHRVAANVKQTDFPLIQRLRNLLAGLEQLETILKYASHPTFTEDTQLVDKKYVDDTAFSGAAVISATTASRGVVELATQLETASSSTIGGSGATVIVAASTATSTYNAATAPLRVVVTQNSGLIDQGFLPSTTTKSVWFTGTTTVATTTATGLSNFASTSIRTLTATTTAHAATSTYSKPYNLRYVIVELVSGGDGGAVGSGTDGHGAGGNGGGYTKKIFLASQLAATETIVAGNGGASATTGAPSKFGSLLSTASLNGDINISGQAGDAGVTIGTTVEVGGAGGNSFMGHGGANNYCTNNICTGTAGTNYGGGGAGGARDNQGAGSTNGGTGGHGVVIITEVYF